jgi:hypothetical protein
LEGLTESMDPNGSSWITRMWRLILNLVTLDHPTAYFIRIGYGTKSATR